MELLRAPVEIRQLTLEEIQSLAVDFESRGESLPDLATATAVGIVAEGRIVGYQFLQVKLHAQPTRVDPAFAHLFGALCRASEELILAKSGPQWVYVFCPPDDRLVKLCESRGMFQEPWIIMSKRVQAAPMAPEALPVQPFVPSPEQLDVFYPAKGATQ